MTARVRLDARVGDRSFCDFASRALNTHGQNPPQTADPSLRLQAWVGTMRGCYGFRANRNRMMISQRIRSRRRGTRRQGRCWCTWGATSERALWPWRAPTKSIQDRGVVVLGETVGDVWSGCGDTEPGLGRAALGGRGTVPPLPSGRCLLRGPLMIRWDHGVWTHRRVSSLQGGDGAHVACLYAGHGSGVPLRSPSRGPWEREWCHASP